MSPDACAPHCDDWPHWQQARTVWDIAFTGHPATGRQLPCPSDARRPGGINQIWPGNQARTP